MRVAREKNPARKVGTNSMHSVFFNQVGKPGLANLSQFKADRIRQPAQRIKKDEVKA
jgi:hypothetical protein